MLGKMIKAWACCMAFLRIAAAAQPGGVSLTGVVSDPHGLVASAPIQVKNKTTGAVARTASAKDGRYSFSNLAPGVYDLSVVMPCCAYNRFAQEVTAEAGRAAQFDIHLTETLNGTTLGDDPARVATAMRDRAKVPNKPAPRMPSGKPDLSGVWLNI